MGSIAAKIDCTVETLRRGGRQAEQDRGERAGATSAEREPLKAWEREVRALCQANAILRKARRMLPRRSATACFGSDRLHGGPCGELRGRADVLGPADRPGLAACLKALRAGDTRVVWKLDRLGRDLRPLINTVPDLTGRWPPSPACCRISTCRLFRGEVIVQFWLKPDERAMTLRAGAEQEKIPKQLRRFL